MLANVVNGAVNASKKAGAFDMLTLPSITGGAAAPSSAGSNTGGVWLSMNSPFSVAGSGGSTASAQGSAAAGIDYNVLIIGALILGGIILILK